MNEAMVKTMKVAAGVVGTLIPGAAFYFFELPDAVDEFVRERAYGLSLAASIVVPFVVVGAIWATIRHRDLLDFQRSHRGTRADADLLEEILAQGEEFTKALNSEQTKAVFSDIGLHVTVRNNCDWEQTIREKISSAGKHPVRALIRKIGGDSKLVNVGDASFAATSKSQKLLSVPISYKNNKLSYLIMFSEEMNGEKVVDLKSTSRWPEGLIDLRGKKQKAVYEWKNQSVVEVRDVTIRFQVAESLRCTVKCRDGAILEEEENTGGFDFWNFRIPKLGPEKIVCFDLKSQLTKEQVR